MAARDRPSTASSPPPPPSGPSASGDQPDGLSRNGRKRKRDETDRPQDSKRSRVEDTLQCMKYHVAHGQFKEALAYTRTNVCGVSNTAMMQRCLQKIMIFLITKYKINCRRLGPDYADVMVYLLSQRLEDYNWEDADIFRLVFREYLKPDYTETLLKLVDEHATSLTDKRKMWRIMFRVVEHVIKDVLERLWDDIRGVNNTVPEYQQQRQNLLVHLVQMLPAMLHIHADPAMSRLRDKYDTSMFEIAVGHQLVQEAKLLYETGAVNNAELMAVANNPGIQKKLSDEEDQSKMTVFLRKVLKQPRRLESMAVLQVSRLVGQQGVLGMEDRVRQLPLPSALRDAVLLRPQISRYRKETERNDQSTDGGV